LDSRAFLADPISVDKNLDFSADVIYMGETYWAANRWNGKMYRIIPNPSANPADWVLSTLFQTDPDQAITVAPTAALGYDKDLWVYFGTGRLYNGQDKADQSTQAFYGIHDACMEGGDCGAVTSILNVTDEKVFSDGSVQGPLGPTDFTALEEKFRGETLTNYGWKIELDPGKRTLSKASILGGAVFFTTFTPDSDICSMGGEGDLYALYFLTGTAYYKPILDNKDIETNEELLKSVSMGIGMPANLGLHVGSSRGSRGPTGFIQTSTGNIISKALSPPLMYRSREVSWKQ
jgi:type IV pilus assembly protein PilY1